MKKMKKKRNKQADIDVQDTEAPMVVDSERTSRFSCFCMCCYNYHPELKEQETGKKKKRRKKHLEPMSVDEGLFKIIFQSSVELPMVCRFYTSYRRQGEKEKTQAQ